MIKVFQVCKDCLGTKSYNVKLKCIATVEVNCSGKDVNDIKDLAWHACNVDCWDDTYQDGNPVDVDGIITVIPTSDFPGYCGSDVFVTDGHDFWVAKSFGWEHITSEYEAVMHIIKNSPCVNEGHIKNIKEFSNPKHVSTMFNKLFLKVC